MTLSQLRVLHVVANTGNLTRAAAQLGTTQPAVSHALRALEHELGAVLFTRRTGGVTLTPVGQAVSERVAIILNQLEGIQQAASTSLGHTHGRLRLGVIASVNVRLLPNVLRRFTASHERVRLTVLEGSDAEVIDWLRKGAVDIATVTSVPPDVDATEFADDQLLAVVPLGHRLAERRRIRVSDLANEPFVMSTGGCEPLIKAIAARQGVHLRTDYRARDTSSIISMVTEGLGVTIMPALSVPSGHVEICVRPLVPAEKRRIHFAVPRDRALPLAHTFVEFATADRCATIAPDGGVRASGSRGAWR